MPTEDNVKTTEKTEKNLGVALRCDGDGVVREVITNTLDVEKCIQVGAAFSDFVDAASRSKATAFFDLLRQQKAAFGWEMNIDCGGSRIQPMQFAGALADSIEKGIETAESFFIVGANSRAGVSRFYDEMTSLNNEQTNAVRSALKDLSLQMREQAERDDQHYDELSRLNNELATAQRELAKKNVELARLNEQKNQFLGIAAHDLRNPLEVISNYSEFLLEDAKGILDEEQFNFVERINASSGYMLSLVNDFLDYSKIEAGRLELNKTQIDVSKLVRRVAESARILADKKRIQLKLNVENDLPKTLLDESKIEQVLNNLLSNAIKFSPPAATIEFGASSRANEIVFSVKDQGPGIASDDAELIFRPFVKGKTNATGGEKSSGLGLAIVKKIVEGHGGEIRLETEIEKGTVFYVTLPVKL